MLLLQCCSGAFFRISVPQIESPLTLCTQGTVGWVSFTAFGFLFCLPVLTYKDYSSLVNTLESCKTIYVDICINQIKYLDKMF